MAISVAGIFLVDIPGIILSRLFHQPRRKWGWYFLLAVLDPVIRGLVMLFFHAVVKVSSAHAGFFIFNALAALILTLLAHFILRLKLRETTFTALIIFTTALILFYIIAYATMDAIPEGGVRIG